MPVDEKALGESIVARGSYILPLGFLFLEYFVLTGNQWLIAILALSFAIWYHLAAWDGRILLGYGVFALLLAAPLLEGSAGSASNLALAGYWLSVAGCIRLASALIMPAGHGKEPGAKLPEAHGSAGRKTKKRTAHGKKAGKRDSGPEGYPI